ncbi:MAG: hypothetical protein GXO65_03755, partial [Euryarchaeota archaeon]|nr:hypothetical protein [Euryarchaeota archaeon]
SFRGWNSSIATIPRPTEDEIKVITEAELPGVERKELEEYLGIRIMVPKEKDCRYCHQSAYYPTSLHDVHRPVLEKACASCHNRTRSHSGNICVSCHKAIGINSTAVREANCRDNACHTSTKAERQRIHLKESACLNCHNSTGGEGRPHHPPLPG